MGEVGGDMRNIVEGEQTACSVGEEEGGLISREVGKADVQWGCQAERCKQ